MGKTNQYYEIDLLQLLRALWRKAWAIALAAVIGGGLAFSYAAFLVTPLYEADVMLYVNNTSVGSANPYISNAELTAAQSLVDTYIGILKSRTTINEVIHTTGVNYSYKELESMLSAEQINGTELFSISVTSSDPQEAELIAGAIVDILPGRIAEVVEGSSVRVVDDAEIPTEKTFPNTILFTTIGILLGIAISCIVVIVLLVNDKLIHTEDYLTETYDLPVLAVIPNLYDDSENDYYYAHKYDQRGKAEVKK